MKELSERDWKRFLRAIAEGRVVPIIGKELFQVRNVPLKEYLLKQICEEYDIDYSEELTSEQIIEILNQDFGDGKGEYCSCLRRICKTTQIPIPDSIAKLISTNRFPVILTTTYVPVLEKYLIANNLNWNIYSYDKRGKKSDKADLESSDEAARSLYYLFGKIGNKGSFVATEDDLLAFLHFWHNESTRPANLCSYLSDKFLLVLGCDYPDWLFRFMWYSMNGNFLESPRLGQLVVSNNKVMEDVELQSFLSRIKAYYHNNQAGFIDEICSRWKKYEEENDIPDISSNSNLLANNGNEIDVFISYAREDETEAAKISEILKSLGANVWFDRKALNPGDSFPDEIKESIIKCKRFMPILSRNTIIPGSRFYRKEWTEAIEESKARLGQQYITPVRLDDFDVTNRLIPEEFKKKIHMIKYYEDDLIMSFKEIIRSIRR